MSFLLTATVRSAAACAGSPATIHARAFVAAASAAARGTASRASHFAAFDHAAFDAANARHRDPPLACPLTVPAGPGVVIVEGSFVLLAHEPWGLLRRDILDQTWFLDCGFGSSGCGGDEEVEGWARRLLRRHARWAPDPEAARARVLSNDLPNARLAWASRWGADVTVTPPHHHVPPRR